MPASELERRHNLAHLPTPLWRSDALDRLIETEVWVKRDDMTSGAAAGNKIRKLEYLLAEAATTGATAVMTCGGFQSNHARATALLARELSMPAILYLRTAEQRPAVSGNPLLSLLAGAEIRLITASQYRFAGKLMAEAAQSQREAGHRVYVIPEGGSSGRGALGYVAAMREIGEQLQLGLGGGRRYDAIVHACGSGGTAAGCLLGALAFDVASTVHAFAVCDDRQHFEAVIGRIVAEARELVGTEFPSARLIVHDEFKGPAYGVSSPEQIEFLREVVERTGLVLDPVYSGKALFGLAQLRPKPQRVLFIHTGGLPGLLAQSSELRGALGQLCDFRQ